MIISGYWDPVGDLIFSHRPVLSTFCAVHKYTCKNGEMLAFFFGLGAPGSVTLAPAGWAFCFGSQDENK